MMGTEASIRSEKMSHSAIISFAGSAFAAVSAMLLTVMIGRGLGADGAGLFFLGVGLFTIATQILKLGSNSGIIRTISRQRALGLEGHSLQVLLIATLPVISVSIGAAVLFIYFSAPISLIFVESGNPEALEKMIRGLSFFVCAASVLAVLQTMVRMLNGVLWFTLLQNVFLPLTRLILVGIALWWGWDALEVVRAWALSLPFWVVVTLGLLIPALRRDLSKKQAPLERGSTGDFWRFSASRGVGGALEIGLEWSDVLIVAAFRTPAEAGIYAVVTRVIRAGQIVDRAMRVAVSPRIAHHLALDERKAVRRLRTDATIAMILVSWPFYLTLIFMGKSVLSLFGPEFSKGAAVLAISSVAIMISTSTGMLQSIILMGGNSSWQVSVKAIALGSSVALNLWLVPRWGILGAAVSWAIVVLIDTCISSYLVNIRMRVGMDRMRVFLACLLAGLTFGVGWPLLQWMGDDSLPMLVFSLLLLTLIYFVVLFAARKPLGVAGKLSEILLNKRQKTKRSLE